MISGRVIKLILLSVSILSGAMLVPLCADASGEKGWYPTLQNKGWYVFEGGSPSTSSAEESKNQSMQSTPQSTTNTGLGINAQTEKPSSTSQTTQSTQPSTTVPSNYKLF